MKKIFLAISKGRIMDEALILLKKNNIECDISPNKSRKLIFKFS